jgi:hypothetical protein
LSRIRVILDDDCSKIIFNKTRTVIFQFDGYPKLKTCEIEVLGKSTDLVLGNPRWVERHRFFVEMGFDGKETMSVLVFHYEPMFRTTPDLLPESDWLFEYMGREHDTILRVFQQKMAAAIIQTLKERFQYYEPRAD